MVTPSARQSRPLKYTPLAWTRTSSTTGLLRPVDTRSRKAHTRDMTNSTVTLVLSPAEVLLADAKAGLRYEISTRGNGITRAMRRVREAEAAVAAERKEAK